MHQAELFAANRMKLEGQHEIGVLTLPWDGNDDNGRSDLLVDIGDRRVQSRRKRIEERVGKFTFGEAR